MRFFVGYDLGDGEASLHLLKGVEADGSDVKGIPLPGRRNEGPIPTILARKPGKLAAVGQDAVSSREGVEQFSVNFKRRPSTLITPGRLDEFFSLSGGSEQGGECPDWPEDAAWQSLTELKNRVVEFTDAIFLNHKVSSFITSGTDEIDVFVGHPTTWTERDVELYRRIFEQTCLGKDKNRLTTLPLRFNLEKESRAAFLQTRASGGFKLEELLEGAHAVLFDFGSSTTDVTIVSGLRLDESLKDEGHPNLGARLIDEGIFDYVCEAMPPDEGRYFEQLREKTPNFKERCVYHCRLAKEQYFSADPAYRTDRRFGLAVKGFHIDDYLDDAAMQRVLRTPQSSLGNISWVDASRQLFERVKQDMGAQGKEPSMVILTGGASLMDFVSDQCRSVFESSACTVMQDPSPCETISKGLALVARSNHRADELARDIDEYCRSNLASTIADQIDTLADAIAPEMADFILDEVVTPAALKWRRSGYSTLAAMEAAAISNANAAISGKKGKQIVESVSKMWLSEKVLPAIDRKTRRICAKHGVSSLHLEELARLATKVASSGKELSIDGFRFGGDIGRDLVGGFSTTLFAIAGVLALMLAPAVLPVILSVVGTIVGVITGIIVVILVVVFGANPACWPFVAILVGIGGVWGAIGGFKAIRKALMDQARTINFYQWLRNLVSEEEIRSKVNAERYKVISSIADAIKHDGEMKKRLGSDAAGEIKKIVDQAVRVIRMKIQAE